MTRPALVSSSDLSWVGAQPSLGANPSQDFNNLRRECGTAPGGATRRSPRSRNSASTSSDRKAAVQELLKDESWFADADTPLDSDLLDDCPSPTLFLSEPSPSLFGDMGMRDVFDAADPDESSGDVDAELPSEPPPGAADAERRNGPVSAGAGRPASCSEAGGSTPRSGSGRSLVEGGMNLSPRGSFERGKKAKGHRTQNGGSNGGREPESSVLKGLLNSAEMEDRLAAAQQVRVIPHTERTQACMQPRYTDITSPPRSCVRAGA